MGRAQLLERKMVGRGHLRRRGWGWGEEVEDIQLQPASSYISHRVLPGDNNKYNFSGLGKESFRREKKNKLLPNKVESKFQGRMSAGRRPPGLPPPSGHLPPAEGTIFVHPVGLGVVLLVVTNVQYYCRLFSSGKLTI